MTNIFIDANNFTLIAYTASLGKTNSAEDTNNLFFKIITNMLKNLRKTFEGNFYAVWDTYGGTHYRKELDSSYKANRNNNRFDFEAIESCKEFFELYDIKNIRIPECEADDAIFALCRIFKEKSSQNNNIIVTRDKDLIQIVQEGYANNIWDPSKKIYMEIPWYSIVKFKALSGDPADGITGVKGIGPKTAIKIIEGSQHLTEQEQEQYEKCLKLVDAKLNPNYEKIYSYAKELI